jgi:hypothetical protein
MDVERVLPALPRAVVVAVAEHHLAPASPPQADPMAEIKRERSTASFPSRELAALLVRLTQILLLILLVMSWDAVHLNKTGVQHACRAIFTSP